MKRYFIITGTITYAIKCRDALRQNGYKAELKRTVNSGGNVGCGYGVIDIILGKLVDAEFLGVDVNRRALHLAEMNKKENKLTNVNFIESSCYENVDGKFNVIITNPPIRAGKKIVYEIVMGAKDYLEKDGTLYIVVRKEQGAKSMIRDLEEIYKVEVLNKIKGFFVIKCKLD